jgi:integrase
MLQPYVDEANKQATTGFLREDVTVRQFVEDRWLPAMRHNYAPSSKQGLESELRAVLKFFGDLKLSIISGEHLARFISAHSAAGFAPKTIKNRVWTLRAVWNDARAWNYVEHDPFFRLKLPKPQKKVQRFFTEEEAERIVLACDAAGEKDWALLFRLWWLSGLRFGELSVVAPESFKFAMAHREDGGEPEEVCRFKVIRSRWHGHIREMEGKTKNAIRSMWLGPAVTCRIREYLATWRPNETRCLFATSTGRPWAYSFVRRKLVLICACLGIEDPQTKAFRHGNATWMFSENVPAPVITSRLGHHAIGFSEREYAKPLMSDELKLAFKMDRGLVIQ